MNNLKIKNFNESILEKAKLITKGNGFFKTYDLNNGNIIKVVKSVNEIMSERNAMNLYSSYNDFIDNIYDKLCLSEEIQSKSIVLPNAIYLEKDIPIAYTIPKQNLMIGGDKYFEKNKDLKSISELVIKMSNEVKAANKEKINFPDLGNLSNILINPDTKDIKFIDYDGLQIKNFNSFSISGLVNDLVEPHVTGTKYYNCKTGLANNNLDKLSLYAVFLYCTTGTFATDFGPDKYTYKDHRFVLKEKAFLDYTKSIGIEDTSLEEDLYDLFYEDKLKYPTTSIKRLLKTHDLSNKKFIRK